MIKKYKIQKAKTSIQTESKKITKKQVKLKKIKKEAAIKKNKTKTLPTNEKPLCSKIR